MAGSAAERRGILVVHFADEKPAAPRIDFGRSSARLPYRRGVKLHVLDKAHLAAQGVESRVERRVEFENEAQEHEPEVAVN